MIMMLNDADDYWGIEPRFMNVSDCLIKQEPHHRSILLVLKAFSNISTLSSIKIDFKDKI